ncbi:MAG TPA: ATP-dependent DNA helicase UvrD2, partial [Acidimicrobiales bacterium]
LGTAPRVLDEREVRRLVDGLLPRARQRRANTDPIAPYLEALQETRLGLRAPAEVEVDRGDVPGFAALFAPYRAALKQQGVVDFDDQVYRAIEVLLADGALRRRLQERHRHMLVDEFQDLTPAHVLLVRLLAAPRLDVFGVGDDDQVIYGHAGADPSFLIDFASLFPAAHEHALEVNHRCPAPVVEAAANLLSHNRRRVPKVILSAPTAATGADRLRVVRERPDHLAVAVRDAVLAWRAEGVADADIAVLARVNSLLLAPQVALAEAGVALMPMVETNVLQRLGVRAVLAYLRLATGEKWAKSDLVEVYRRPSRGLPEWIQKWLRDGASANSLRAAAERIDDAKVADKLVSLVDDIQALQALARKGADTRRLMVSIRDDVGLGAAIEQLDRTKGEGSSQLDDVEALLQLADLHPDPASFESWVASALRTPPSGDGVTLATVHKVKGREWPYVVLFGVTAGILPHRLAADDEEERRVLHVAITRASRQVVLVADATRPSSFLPELEQPAPPQIDGSPPAPTVTRGRPQPPPKPGPAIDPGDPVAAALKAWRSQRSRADGVPAYVVFDDKTLAELARVRPESLTELARIKGIGPAKLDRYGEEVIALLASLA